MTIHIRFYNGATPAGAGASLHPRRALSRPSLLVAPTDGRWLLSPDKVQLTVTSLGLTGATVATTGVACTVAYDKSNPGLTQLTDCPVTVPPGTYTGVSVTESGTYTVTLDDAANGFYSTASGIVTAPPAGGAQSLTISTSAAGNHIIPFSEPLVVSDTSTVAVSVVLNGLQFFHVSVSGGVVSLGWPGTSFLDPSIPDLVASVGTVAQVDFYSNQAIGSAGGFCFSCAVSTQHSLTSVSVYYSAPATPVIVGMLPNDVDRCIPRTGIPGFLNDHRSYLGLGASGNLGWASATDTSWTAYVAVFRMAQVSAIGGSTVLYCQTTGTNPAPAGGSFASGAPNIAVASNSLGTYVLVAR